MLGSPKILFYYSDMTFMRKSKALAFALQSSGVEILVDRLSSNPGADSIPRHASTGEL